MSLRKGEKMDFKHKGKQTEKKQIERDGKSMRKNKIERNIGRKLV